MNRDKKQREEMIDMCFVLSETFAEDNALELEIVMSFVKEIQKVVSTYSLNRGAEIAEQERLKGIINNG